MNKKKVILIFIDAVFILTITIFMYLADCRLYVYPLFLIINAILLMFIIRKAKLIYIILSIIGLLFLSTLGLIYGRENINVSVIGTVTYVYF